MTLTMMTNDGPINNGIMMKTTTNDGPAQLIAETTKPKKEQIAIDKKHNQKKNTKYGLAAMNRPNKEENKQEKENNKADEEENNKVPSMRITAIDRTKQQPQQKM